MALRRAGARASPYAAGPALAPARPNAPASSVAFRFAHVSFFSTFDAALSTSGALESDLRYEYIGDWSKVRGKWEKRESKKTDAGGEATQARIDCSSTSA